MYRFTILAAIFFSIPLGAEEVEKAEPLFEWFDSLGYSIPDDSIFAEINSGGWLQFEGNKIPILNAGFVTKQTDDGFDTISLDLNSRFYATDLSKKNSESGAYQPSFKKKGFDVFLKRVMLNLEKKDGLPDLQRGYGFRRGPYFSHHVLRVGDCAQRIIYRISGESFFETQSTFSYMTKGKDAGEAGRRARVWWAEFQKKGEEAMLVESVKAGERDSHPKLDMLLTKYPDAAFAAIREGLKNAKDAWLHEVLFSALVKSKASSDEIMAVVVSQLETGHGLAVRVDAATWLWVNPKRRAQANSAMFVEWSERKKIFRIKDGWGHPSKIGKLINYLLSSNDPRLIQQLIDDYESMEREVVISLIDVFGAKSKRDDFLLVQNEKNEMKVSDDCFLLIEKLGLKILADKRVCIGRGGTNGDVRYQNPYFADIVSYAMAKIWPDRYESSLGKTGGEGDKIRLKNIEVGKN